METEDLALEVRRLFVEQKRKLFPGYTIPGNMYEDCFMKAAEEIEKLHGDPEVYVFSQFYLQEDNAKLIPQFLGTQRAVDRYLDFVVYSKSVISPTTILTENLNKLKTQLRMGFSLEEILKSKSFKFPSWFRLCISKEPIKDLMEDVKLRNKALSEFNDKIKELLEANNLDYKRITSWTMKEEEDKSK